MAFVEYRVDGKDAAWRFFALVPRPLGQEEVPVMVTRGTERLRFRAVFVNVDGERGGQSSEELPIGPFPRA